MIGYRYSNAKLRDLHPGPPGWFHVRRRLSLWVALLVVAAVVIAGGLWWAMRDDGGGDLNCSDFGSQADAQRVYDATPGDPYDLDRDGDGVACEGLR